MITVKVEPLLPAHLGEIPRVFAVVGWPGKNANLYHCYLAEQSSGTRAVLVASAAQVMGYVTVLWGSGYIPFRDAGIPDLTYLSRGYLPDGLGIAYRFAPVVAATTVRADDDVNLMMTRVM